MTDDLPGHDLVEVAGAIKRGEVSSQECVQACLNRIGRLQPLINAFIRVDADSALDAGAQADSERARGAALGPLHGVPMAHKDLVYRAGRISTGGSKILADVIADTTATALARIDRAGAVDLGTLNMSEFAAGGTGHNQHHGDCHNPWNLKCATGGSSSGSGAAVAARMVYGALGSDTGGSVRMPAALCGVVGLKPTDGRVSRYGVMPRSWTTDTLGPLTRSARDAARLLGVIAGYDRRDPSTRTEPVPDYEGELDESLDGVRIGIPSGAYFEQVDGAVGGMLDAVRQILSAAGTVVSNIAVPDPQAAFDLGEIVVKSEAASLHEPWLRDRPDDYSVAIRVPIEGGLYIPAPRYLHALRLRGPMLEEFCGQAFAKADVVLLPAAPGCAPRLAECDPNSAAGAMRTMASFPRFTRPISYLGLPALVLPGGFTAEGLPLSFQLVAPPFAEGMLLRVGHQFQKLTAWHQQLPPL
jgi:aspartyl-tRNA(Asn)/glutamyl-tRNA(Gln) amidotransferase subunit A